MKVIKPYLEHILQECEFISNQSQKLDFESFIKDPLAIRAFVRSLEIIGEAVKNLPDEFKNKHAQIPWKKIAGMRDKLIHGYFGVDYRIVWKTIQKEIPELKKEIDLIVNSIKVDF